MEALFQKIMAFLQPHYPIVGGSIFHLLFIRMKNKGHGITYSALDLINLGLISFSLGVLVQYVATGYYEYKELEPKAGVILAIGIMGAVIRFNGVVYFIKKFQLYFDKYAEKEIEK